MAGNIDEAMPAASVGNRNLNYGIAGVNLLPTTYSDEAEHATFAALAGGLVLLAFSLSNSSWVVFQALAFFLVAT
jgi:hypothetical protein